MKYVCSWTELHEATVDVDDPDYAMEAAEIRFVRGRLQFVGGKSKAPFPSVILIFKPGKHVPKVSSYEST